MKTKNEKPKTWEEWYDWIDKDFKALVKSQTIRGKERARLMKILKEHGGAKIIS